MNAVRKARFTLINDHFQNYKSYGVQKAQLVIADIPYNVGKNAYGSNPAWYEVETMQTVKAHLLVKSFSIQTKVSR